MNEFDQSPMAIAERWYSEDAIGRAIQNSGCGASVWDAIPGDVHSPEFAKWLTHQYRLAMAKGIQLGRGDEAIQ